MAGFDKTIKQSASPGITLFVVSVVQFITPFMFSAVGIALPTIGLEFQASAVQLGLIEMVYILAFALFLLPLGRFADIHGRRLIFITGTGLISIATLALGLTKSIESFIIIRFFQGASAAMITTTSFAILTSVFPPEKRGRAIGIIVSCVYTGLSIGPSIAGIITTHFGWHWIFLGAVPFEFAALILTLVKLKGEWAEARGERFDWTGSLIYMVSLAAIVIGSILLNKNIAGKWYLIAGICSMILFMIFEYNTPSPILDVRLLMDNRFFTYSNIATWLNYAASFGVTFFFSIFLQSVKGFSAQTAGFILIIQPVIMAVTAPFSGRLADSYPPERIATIGMAVCAVGLSFGAAMNVQTSLTEICIVLVLLGFGFGLFSTPNMTAIMGSVQPRHYGVASSMVATMRSAGMLTSMTIITIIISLFMGNDSITQDNQILFISSMHTALITFSIMSFAGIAFSLGRLRLR
ncbi:Major facilitator superfamily protein [Desulfonema limicola]|uniref:Major facilitator superfamily protein n=1 Tax=Desulfonema limicola TaxID=45656 RepID=A0A975B7Y7_9BACT|nr:MFS transporter [Desulfonema limicola]QTA80493.1 Major facilitator superfamily protein [Desulfonema limicola]